MSEIIRMTEYPATDEEWELRDSAYQAMFDRVVGRLRFELTYARDQSRRFTWAGIMGADIPNSYRNEKSTPTASGSWDNDEIGMARSERDLVRELFRSAINEAVHEALEWFHLDDAALLDPHGEHEAVIQSQSQLLADFLLDLSPRYWEFSADPEVRDVRPIRDMHVMDEA